MKIFSAIYLLITLAATVAVMFLKAKWATSIPETLAFALAAAWAIAFLTGKAKPGLSAALIPFAGILIWAGVQLAAGTTVYRWPTRLGILYWAGNLAIFFCGLQIFGDRRLRDRFLRALTFFGFAVVILSTVQALTSQGKIYWIFVTEYTPEPIFGPFLYRNQYAAFIELLLPVALYYALTDRKRRILYFAITATLYGSLIACASRAGFVLSTLELGLVPMIVSRRQGFSRSQVINGALVMAGMLLWLAIPAGPDALISKFGAPDPYGGRREFNESSLRMIQARPLMGFGLGNWPTAYPGYAIFDDGLFANQAHNDWAQWAVEGGLPLLCLMLWLAGWAAQGGLRTGWGLGVPIVFVHCFVDYPIQRPGVAVLFFLLLAALAGAGASSGAKEAGS
jgi:O-antigen ligase